MEINANLSELLKTIKQYGSYCIKRYNNDMYYSFTLETEKDCDEVRQNVEKEIENIEFFEIQHYVNGEIKTETIIDNRPKLDDDEEEEPELGS